MHESSLRRAGAAVLWLGVASAAPAGVVPVSSMPSSGGAWDFAVTLDGKPIGEHRFRLTAAATSSAATGDQRQLVSQARFVVKVLGITAYRYDHRAVEQWQGDCLRSLASETDDDGRAQRVQAQGDAQGLRVEAGSGAGGGSSERTLPGCVMSFAYWNPAIRQTTRLLNAQTGVAEKVRVERVDEAVIDVHGRPTPATRWRISGVAAPIDVWYAADDGAWVGLDSTLAGGRRLSYRLK
jgi:hypothetical protein